MVKDFKYIIKRIIIGVGIALALMYLRGNLLIGVNAEQMNFGPNDIVITGQSINTFTSNSLTYNNETVWTVPQNNYITGGWYYIYFFRYPQFSGANYCNQTSNNGSISGRIYGLGFSFETNSTIKFEDVTTGGGYKNCQFTITGGTAAFTCNDINLSHSINIVGSGFYIPNTSDRYGISKIDVNCTMTNEGLANSINNSINNQTNTIINNQNTNTQNIINNQNTNTQNIINNQNENTEKEIESQKVCNYIDNKNIGLNSKYLSSTGSELSASAFIITNYIPIDKYTEIKVVNTTASTNIHLCFYNINKEKISCILENTLNVDDILTIPSNSSFVRFTISKAANIPTFNICKNGNQAIADAQQEINDSLNDDTGVSDNDIESLFGEFEDSDSPISDLLTMPITLLNAYISGMNGTCQSISLGRLYGTNLIIPCINLEEKLGSSLWNTIDILFSLFMIYNISQLFITAFDGLTSLKDSFDWLYGVEGRHVATGTRMDRYGD